MHVAETHLELVGTDALRIKEESQKEEPASSGLLSGGTINTQPRRLLVSESPAIESTSPKSSRVIVMKLIHRCSQVTCEKQ